MKTEPVCKLVIELYEDELRMLKRALWLYENEKGLLRGETRAVVGEFLLDVLSSGGLLDD